MSISEKLLLKAILEIIDFDWRDACNDICVFTHPKGRNPHLGNVRKQIIELFEEK